MRRLTTRLVTAQVLDALTFVVFAAFFAAGSIHHERNPLIIALLALGGIQAVGLFKIGISLIVAYRAEHTTKPLSVRYQRTRTILISAATASGIVGAGFNVASIIHTVST